jgi:hypothetical protein
VESLLAGTSSQDLADRDNYTCKENPVRKDLQASADADRHIPTGLDSQG